MEKYCDFKKSNLSIINYSSPIDDYLELNDLKDHIYTIKSLPNAIPPRPLIINLIGVFVLRIMII